VAALTRLACFNARVPIAEPVERFAVALKQLRVCRELLLDGVRPRPAWR
jgi:hypothetical protein